MSPLFSTKCSKRDKIILNENDKYVSNDGELCQIFCDYNHGHNNYRLFDTLPNFLSTTSETKRDY